MSKQSQHRMFMGEFSRRVERCPEYIRKLDPVLQPDRIGSQRIYTERHVKIVEALGK